MSGTFLYLGSVTSTMAGQTVPNCDTTAGSSAVTATTMALSTAVPAVSPALNRFKDFEIVITAGSGAGQRRRILSSSSAAIAVATVRPWELPRPDTGSSFAVGVPINGRDGFAVKGEASAVTTTGTWRGLFVTAEAIPKRVVTTPFQLAVPSSGYAQEVSSTGTMHTETRVIDFLGPIYAVGKVYCDIATTANVELYGAGTFTAGRERG